MKLIILAAVGRTGTSMMHRQSIKGQGNRLWERWEIVRYNIVHALFCFVLFIIKGSWRTGHSPPRVRTGLFLPPVAENTCMQATNWC